MIEQSALLAGVDIPIPECQITLKQPSVKELSMLGEKKFFTGLQTLTIDTSLFPQDKVKLARLTNFQIFMTVMQEKEGIEKREIVEDLLYLIFPSYQIIMTPRSIIFQNDNISSMIDENNFNTLQEVLKDVFCLNNSQSQGFNVKSKLGQEIAEKIMRGRQRVAAEKGGGNMSVFSQYTSSLSIGLRLPITTVLEYTLYQLYDQMERFGLHTSWDIDMKSRLAGAKIEKKPEDWMKNIH